MAKIIYKLEKEQKPAEDGPIEKISVEKMRNLAIQKQIETLGIDESNETTATHIGDRKFRLRYRDPELKIFKSQTFTPYIGKSGKLIVVKGKEEIELTPEMIKASATI